MAAVKTEKLGFWKKFAFGMGDIYGGGSGVVIGFYYLVFLTDVIRINPGLAGTVILISKLYDAITDPFEGLIVDRTRTRWGRRRPYLIAGIPLVFLSFFLMWYPFALQNEILRFVFVVLTYLFFSTIVSIVMLSYNAIIPELTTDYHERTSISSFRIFFSTVASIISAVLPLEIVKMFPDIRQGYIVMALIFGLFYALPFIATVAVVKERKEYLEHSPAKLDLKEGFVEPFKIKSFVYVLFMYLLAFVAMDVVSSVVVYFMKNYLERPGDITLVNGTLLVFQVLALPFYVWLSKRTSKRTGYIIGALIWMVVMLTSLLMSPLTPRLAVYAFAAAIGLGTGGIVVMIYAIFPDIPDIGELRNGKRQEGTYSALTGFMRKLSSAFSLFLVGNLLSLTGYKPPVEQVAEGVTKMIEQPQSPVFILALRLLFVLVPLVLLGAAVALAWRYPLTAALHQQLLGVLEKLRKGGNEKKAAEKEASELKALLIGKEK
jgi:oligogalacturonide transporter